MRILLTGASGQIGGAIRPLLAHHELLCPGRAELDLENGAALEAHVVEKRPDLIINCAAYTAVDAAQSDQERALQINSEAPRVMAAAARQIGAALLHLSTDYVFDGTGTRPYREDDPTAPINVYGQTKRQGELAVAAAGGQYQVLRTSWIYDAKGNNFLRTMLRLGLSREAIDVVNDQTGSPTSAAVVALAIARLAEGVADQGGGFGAKSGILNLTCAGSTTWYGFAAAIFDEMRRRGAQIRVKAVNPVTSSQFVRPARRPAYSVLDLARLRNEFGIVTPSWQEALRDVLDRLNLSELEEGSS